MTFGTLAALASAVWLSSCGSSALALYWSLKRNAQRRLPALVLSAMGLLIGYLGWSRVQLSASKTVNGHLVWSINSKWLFLAAIILGACSLALAVWNYKKSCSRGDAAVG